jgi:hypothetical protein
VLSSATSWSAGGLLLGSTTALAIVSGVTGGWWQLDCDIWLSTIAAGAATKTAAASASRLALMSTHAYQSAAGKCSNYNDEYWTLSTRRGASTCVNDCQRPVCVSFTPRGSSAGGKTGSLRETPGSWRDDGLLTCLMIVDLAPRAEARIGRIRSNAGGGRREPSCGICTIATVTGTEEPPAVGAFRRGSSSRD